MRILIYSESFSPELVSTGKYTGEMAQWLAAQGHHVKVVTTPPHFPQWKVFDGHSASRYKRERSSLSGTLTGKLEVIRCPAWIPREPHGWKRVFYLGSFALTSLPIVMSQMLWRPDVVFLVEPTFFCAPAALCAARLSGAVSWLHVQDFEIDVAFRLGSFSSLRLRRMLGSVEQALLKRFARVSAISSRMVDRLSVKGVQSGRAVLFPNWVDTSQIYPLPFPSPLRTELGIDTRSFVALFSGSMGIKHGLKVLADASRVLVSRSDIRFVICGDGPYRESLVQLTKGSSNVTFLPLQPPERLNDLLNLADVHLLPQLADAGDLVMPSKLTGMLASGRPVVATANPGTQIFEVLRGKGCVTQPGDPNAFASAITTLADVSSLRRQMGEEARRYAVDHLDRDDVLSRFEAAVLASRGCPRSPAEKRLVTEQNKESPTF